MQKIITSVTILFFCGSLFAGYVEDRDAAVKLMQSRKYEEALAAFKTMSEGKVSDLQKSDALEQAAACARAMKKFDVAMELALQIPLAPNSKAVQMRTLLENRQSKELVEKFKGEDLDQWPETVSGQAFYCRGRAWFELGNGEAAAMDLEKAAELITGDLERAGVWQLLGDNYRQHLKDDGKALGAYMKIVERTQGKGDSAYLQGVVSASQLLLKQKKHDEAQAVVRKVDMDKLQGYWHGVLLCTLGEICADAGRKAEALAAYKNVLKDEQVHPGHRKAAEAAIAKLEAAQ